MKKVSLLLMIILLVFSQLSLSYYSVSAISNNESSSEDSGTHDELMSGSDGSIVQPNDNDTDNNSLKSNTEDELNSDIEDDKASTEDEDTSLNAEKKASVPNSADDFVYIKAFIDIPGISITGWKGDQTPQDVVIPDMIEDLPVIEIANNAFSKKVNFTSVTIPSSVKKIEYSAFRDTQLASVEFLTPSNLTTIEKDAFSHNKLTNVTIPPSVTTIGNSAFAHNKLTNVTIPSSVTKIGEFAFYNNKLEGVEIPSSVTKIGRYAFRDNQLTSVTIPSNVTTIGEFAFAYNQLESVEISSPSSVTKIEEYAFSHNQLESVEIPSGVTTIGMRAFTDNQLTSIKIAESVTTLEIGAFSKNRLKSIDIPGSVTTIGSGAFANNQLTSVKIPPKVTTIEYGTFGNNQLTSVDIHDEVTTIEDQAFINNQLTSVKIPPSVMTIGEDAFSKNKLTSVEIPPKVTTIEKNAFSRNQLTSIGIHDEVTTIRSYAFNMNKLANVEIPASVTTIENDAFNGNPFDFVTFNGEHKFQWDKEAHPFGVYKEGEKYFHGWFEDKAYTINWDYSVTKPMTIYTKWRMYVKFDVNGGSLVPTQPVVYGELVTAPDAPVKEGYTFEGWYKDKELTKVWDFDKDVVKRDITLYAKWSKVSSSYTVTFDTNGGSEVPSQTVGYKELVKAPSTPVKVGYTFGGWYKDKELTKVWNFNQDRVEKDITLYAKWSKESYIVTFDANGGSEVSSQSIEYGKLIKAPSTPVKVGYTFGGWYKDNELTKVWNFNQDRVEKDITLYAKWSKESYIVTFDANGGSEVPSQSIEYGKLIKAPSTSVKAGYTFDGWHKDKELTVLWDFAKDVVTKNVTLYAKWTKDHTSGGGSGGGSGWTHLNTVTFDSDGGSEVPPQTVGFNDLVKVPSTPVKDGYQFTGWYKDAELKNAWGFTKDKVTADITLYAKWTKDNVSEGSYIVTFDSNGGSKIPSQTVAHKALVKAPSKPTKEGHIFIGWYKNKDFTKAWDFAKDVVTEDLTLYARWMQESNGCDITFNDIDNNWAQEMIEEIAKRCIIIGYPDGTFRPNDMAKRQHVVLMIDRALRPAPIREAISFSDVPKNHIYYEQITRLQRAGIVDGSNGAFRPDAKITRAQMAKMMVLAFGLSPEGNSTFKDVDPSHWASGYIATLADHNIALGDENGNFRPNENLTRAQFTALMYRALGL
ncbi:hypothetical protein LSPCS325_33700 [Lysinibacillus sp. CTST325]